MLANCSQCYKPFAAKQGVRICSGCAQAEQDQYRRVYSYVLQNPGTTIQDVVCDTGVPKDQVIKLLRQGFLHTSDDGELPCMRCKNPLSDADRNGRESLYCRRCVGEMSGEIRSSISPASSSPEPKSPSPFPGHQPPDFQKESGGFGYDKRYGLRG